MKVLTSILLLCIISFAFPQEKVEELVLKDSTYTAPVDGVFVDIDSYVSISYELEKLDTLKKKLPEVQNQLDQMEFAVDSMAASHDSASSKLTTSIMLESQSKEKLRTRVVNLQSSYDKLFDRSKKYKSQRNWLGGTVLALLGGATVKALVTR